MHSVTHPPPSSQPGQGLRNRRLVHEPARRAHEALVAAAACLERPDAGRCQRVAEALKNTRLGNAEIGHLVGESGVEFGRTLHALALRFEALAKLYRAAEFDAEYDPSEADLRLALADSLGTRIEIAQRLGSDWREAMRLDQPIDWEAFHGN